MKQPLRRLKNTALLFCASLYLIPVIAAARVQESKPDTKATAAVSPSENVPLTVLPFTLEYSHIVLSVPILQTGKGEAFRVPKDTRPFRMVLDTGADFTLIAQEAIAARKLALPPAEDGDDTARLNGTGNSGSVTARFVPGMVFSTGGVTFEGAPLVAPLVAPLGLVYQAGVDGILGAEVFKSRTVEVDYAKRVVRMFDPKTFVPPASDSGFVKLPIRFVGKTGRPVVAVDVTPFGFRAATAQLTLDTGAAGTVTFSTPFVKRSGWEAFAPKTVPGTGFGIGGRSDERRGRLKEIRLGGVVLSAPYADFSFNTRGAMTETDSDGLLGGDILQRFTAIFDYERSALYLKPNGEIAAPFPYRYFGLTIGLTRSAGGGWPILRVDDNSPAARAGLKTGDVVYALDGEPLATLSRDAFGQRLSGGKTGERIFSAGDGKGEKKRDVRITPITL